MFMLNFIPMPWVSCYFFFLFTSFEPVSWYFILYALKITIFSLSFSFPHSLTSWMNVFIFLLLLTLFWITHVLLVDPFKEFILFTFFSFLHLLFLFLLPHSPLYFLVFLFLNPPSSSCSHCNHINDDEKNNNNKDNFMFLKNIMWK